jgi:hypothetical protein
MDYPGVALDGPEENSGRPRIGRLVRLRSLFFTSDCVELWPGPPFIAATSLPECRVPCDSLALVLDQCMNSYKVFVNGHTGWVDKQDILPV